MKNKKIKFFEGDVFAVPLRQGGYGIGLLAKKNKLISLVYFFNLIYTVLPERVDAWVFEKNRVAVIGIFSALGIQNGEWPLLKTDFKFYVQDWPIPVFKIKHALTDEFYSVVYDETLVQFERLPISEIESSKLFSDGLYGYGAMEKKLSSVLSETTF